ncbi:hypothetical protein PUR71_22145 [Streptomyces sp. SP17BM10]|uniref:AMP-binding enzyme n=1 Tax=Streptomyces sp. SP17BM10 TaxID=3002530 RepID=UPI002E77ADF0|nr:hypothetical protein [Streptomyces sp. SP17BM10]MEE1785585.1 hypothetical protein [Streptomyces sp. SP17BM10]
MLDEGYLYIVDRLKDLINTGAGHVYTSEVEDILNSHPQVHRSAVFGTPDANRIERVHAVVVPVPGSRPDPQELEVLVRTRRGPLHEPAHVSFLPELPLTDAGWRSFRDGWAPWPAAPPCGRPGRGAGGKRPARLRPTAVAR